MSLFSEKDNNKEPTLLEQYLANPDLDFKDIIGMVCDFLLAGIDTVSCVNWASLYLFFNSIIFLLGNLHNEFSIISRKQSAFSSNDFI